MDAYLVVSVVLWGTPTTTHTRKGENLAQNPILKTKTFNHGSNGLRSGEPGWLSI